MNTEQIQAEAEKLYPPTFEILGIRQDNPVHKALQKAYIAGRSAGLEREKEYREGLSRAIKLLEDCLLNFEANELKQLLNK